MLSVSFLLLLCLTLGLEFLIPTLRASVDNHQRTPHDARPRTRTHS